ncbi:hypothetical protein E3N88_28976 [Mikania micrantha]|uniref:Uncharacterized protein n=1 Tax=Mikania micrantha TaxID=192012 RepID=A0A5N6N3T9_9ASTR|nr:hypothetical protein E3N88_28976 [Mikania micrantha]
MLSSSTTPSPDPKDYRLFELAENVVGEGGYGIVYHEDKQRRNLKMKLKQLVDVYGGDDLQAWLGHWRPWVRVHQTETCSINGSNSRTVDLVGSFKSAEFEVK